MLIEFKVENFLSFRSEEVFSLNAGKGRAFNERLYHDRGMKTLKFSALFGANGAGKSNFVRAISFSRDYIVNGNKRAIIPKHYKLDESCKERPSKFEYKVKIGENIFSYGFEIVLFKNEIISEWLVCHNNRSEELIFSHDRSSRVLKLGKFFKNSELKNRLILYAEGLDSSSGILYLNLINSYKNLFLGYNEADVLKNVFYWFVNKLKVKYPDSYKTDYAYFMSEKNMDAVLGLFNTFDLSISSYKFESCPKEQIAMHLPKDFFENLLESLEKELFDGENAEDNIIMFGLKDDFYIAKIVDEHISFETIKFYHEGSSVPFSMAEESDGTKKILRLLEILFQNEDDIVYIVDEIDRCLHPLLTYNFIGAFLEMAEKMRCQLVVTTHESLLLDFSLLRKDEVRLVTKLEGSSKIDSLGDTTIRADKKLVKEYLLGRKGVPSIKNNKYE